LLSACGSSSSNGGEGGKGGQAISNVNVIVQGYPTVPPSPAEQVQTLPKETKMTDDFQTVRDLSVFDLRAWQPTPDKAPDGGRPERFSPAHYINYLVVRRLTETGSRRKVEYVAQYGTEGSAIDLRCLTHLADLKEKTSGLPKDKAKGKQYAISVDVTREPVGKDFLILVEATFWDGFQGQPLEEASTYTDGDTLATSEIALSVIFPAQKPFQDLQFFEGFETPDGGLSESEYSGQSFPYREKEKRYVYWNITERKPKHFYTLRWNW
jgi:hypothetical protein